MLFHPCSTWLFINKQQAADKRSIKIFHIHISYCRHACNKNLPNVVIGEKF